MNVNSVSNINFKGVFKIVDKRGESLSSDINAKLQDLGYGVGTNKLIFVEDDNDDRKVADRLKKSGIEFEQADATIGEFIKFCEKNSYSSSTAFDLLV